MLTGRAGLQTGPARATPAGTSVDEVILACQGFYALACCRLAHHLRNLGVQLLPVLIIERARRVTGIDILPGASIGHARALLSETPQSWMPQQFENPANVGSPGFLLLGGNTRYPGRGCSL